MQEQRDPLPPSTMTSSTLRPGTSSTTIAPLPDGVAGDLMNRIGEIVGNQKMAAMFKGMDPDSVRATWAGGLAGFTKRELRRGLEVLARKVFPPTLGEFANWCRPALDPEVAWLEAEHGLMARDQGEVGEWTHPAVWRAACNMSPQVRTGEFAKHKVRWAYEVQRELARGIGEGVPLPVKALESKPAKVRAPTEAEKAHMASLKAIVTTPRPAPPAAEWIEPDEVARQIAAADAARDAKLLAQNQPKTDGTL